jgi:hypothetical protein
MYFLLCKYRRHAGSDYYYTTFPRSGERQHTLYIQNRFFSGNGMIKVAAENLVCLEKTEVQIWDRLLKKSA